MEQLVQLFEWTVNVIHKLGYPGVLVLMTVESTFVPIPSELVMPQAGYLAATGQMNFRIALLMATLGSVLGALINYGIAIKMGRPLMLKYGKYFLCAPHKFENMWPMRFARESKCWIRFPVFGRIAGAFVIRLRGAISPAGWLLPYEKDCPLPS